MTQSVARFVVEGRVQGVGFRAWTRRRALELGLRGHAVNLPDGRVEVVAAGTRVALAALHDALHEGPALARVERVTLGDAPAVDHDGFRTG